MKNNYDRTAFEMSFLNGNDILKVKKSIGSITTYITFNDDEEEIQLLRSLEAVQSLHFMLGRLLKKAEIDNEK